MNCRPPQHKALHAAFDALARAYPPLTARDVKQYLLTELPRYLAQAEGREIPPRTKRASTLEMSAAEVNEALAFIDWFAAGAGVNTTNKN